MKRRRHSQLRQSLRQLHEEQARLVDLFLGDEPMARGSVYEMRRRCGKPSCACTTKGRLHATKVLSWSEEGSTRLRVVPKGKFVELRVLTKRYQRFRKARARLVKIHKKMLDLIDQLEITRRVEL